MHRTTRRFLLLSLLLLLLAAVPSSAAEKRAAAQKHYDIVVAAGSPSGLTAAIVAARSGRKVVIAEPTQRLGGMMSNGICKTDMGLRPHASSGLFETFRQRVAEHYKNDPAADDGLKHEPEVANRIFKAMIAAEPNIEVLYQTRPVGVIKAAHNRVRALTVIDKGGAMTDLNGSIFIDSTDEGDLAAWAGAQYRVGREARSAEEPHAGIIYLDRGGIHTQNPNIPHPYRILPHSTGAADPGIQGYSYRFVVKDYGPGSNDRPHVLKTPPPGYDPEKFKHGVRWEKSWASFSGKLPNNKHDVNNYPDGIEMPGENWNWPDATEEVRDKIREKHRNHSLAYLYYLQHVEGKYNLGLPTDDYPENGGFPPLLYVRQGRRILGHYLLTEADINPFVRGNGIRPPLHRDSIATFTFPIDVHPVRPKNSPSDPDSGEGELLLPGTSSTIQVPYRALVPLGLDNVLVTAAVSSTHIGFQGTRLEIMRMAMGMAAGHAAVMSLRTSAPVLNVDIGELQDKLLDGKSFLFFFIDAKPAHPAFKAIQWTALRGGWDDEPGYKFRPDDPLTRAAAARLLVKTLELPISVTHPHYKDLPVTGESIRFVETLFNQDVLGELGVRPEDAQFSPDTPVTAAQLSRLLSKLIGREIALAAAEGSLSRARAAQLLYDALKSQPPARR